MQTLKLSDIIDEDFRKEVEDFFAFATGFGVVFVDNQGNHIGAGSNFTKFCNCVNATEEGRRKCANSNKRATDIGIITKKPSIYVCHAGLVNIEIPLIYDDCCVGAITAGQVLCEEENLYPTDPLAKEKEWEASEELSAFYKEISIVSLKKVEATAVALYNISNYIVQKVAYNQVQKELAEQKAQLLSAQHRQMELQHLLKLTQLDMLEKQVTPHFMFNVLNTVSRLISLDQGDVAKEMIDSFAQMMRYGLSSTKPIVKLEQEMEYVSNYLMIQKVRFADKMNYSIICEGEVKEIEIPVFSIQPLVENSLQHGLRSETAGGTLEVECAKNGEMCSIAIRDNGKGIEQEELNKIRNYYLTSDKNAPYKHIGIYNCYNRLYTLFGGDMTFEISSELHKGVEVKITIPIY